MKLAGVSAAIMQVICDLRARASIKGFQREDAKFAEEFMTTHTYLEIVHIAFTCRSSRNIAAFGSLR